MHGSAPGYAGKNVINPTAVVLSAVMMLRHLGELEAAQRVEDAITTTLEQGIYTRDVRVEGSVTTSAYTDAVIGNLGQRPQQAAPARQHRPLQLPEIAAKPDYVHAAKRRTVGADIFVESPDTPEALGRSLEALAESTQLRLKMISNRGTKVYPAAGAITDCVDHWRCRFVLRDQESELSDEVLIDLLHRVKSRHRWMHIEKLSEFDGALGYTRAQGED